MKLGCRFRFEGHRVDLSLSCPERPSACRVDRWRLEQRQLSNVVKYWGTQVSPVAQFSFVCESAYTCPASELELGFELHRTQGTLCRDQHTGEACSFCDALGPELLYYYGTASRNFRTTSTQLSLARLPKAKLLSDVMHPSCVSNLKYHGPSTFVYLKGPRKRPR